MQPAKRRAKRKAEGPTTREPRYRFVLNPYRDERFSRCPDCEALMKVRKIPLFIHIEPHSLLTLRKTVKLCPPCDLLIVHQDELEAELAFRQRPEIVCSPYQVLGTVEVADWREGMRQEVAVSEMIARLHPFKEERTIQATGGWMTAEQAARQPRRPKRRRR